MIKFKSWKEVSITRKLVIICIAAIALQSFMLIKLGSKLTILALDIFTLIKPELFLWLTIPPAIFLFLIIILIVDKKTSITSKLIIICTAVVALQIFTMIKFMSGLAILSIILSTIFLFLLIILIVNEEDKDDELKKLISRRVANACTSEDVMRRTTQPTPHQ